MALEMKIIYGTFIALALVVLTFTVVLADDDCPPTDVPPQPPPTETNIPPTYEPTPSSPPEETLPPTSTPFEPISEPTPTIEVDPTPTETFAPGVTPTKEKPNKPTPTHDCIKNYDGAKCLPKTGIGDNPILKLALSTIFGFILLGVILILRSIRNGNTRS
jgi:hypothetical protein